MLKERCAHCHNVFEPGLKGLSQVFCMICAQLCEEASDRIYAFLQNNPSASTLRITQSLGVAPVFVYHLFRMKRFTQVSGERRTMTDTFCTICKRLLRGKEDVYCTPCNAVVDKRMHRSKSPSGAPRSERGFRRRIPT